MAVTEIQKVPGEFNLPADWPRLALPDTQGRVADYQASTLTVGNLPTTGWASSLGSIAPLVANPAMATPAVRSDSSGKKYLRMDTSRLEATVDWAGDLTILVVLRPDMASTRYARIVSGGTAGYRAINAEQTNAFAAQTSASGGATSRLTTVTTGQLTAVLGRYSATEVDLKQHGQPWSTPAPTSGHPKQTVFCVGANMANPVPDIAFLHADVYRIQVWNRVLPKAEAEAALQANAATYGL